MKFVKSDKAISTTHKTLGEISVDVEVPQVESLAEFVTFAGGSEQALSFINDVIGDKAKANGRAALRNIPDGGNLDEAKPRIASIVKSYTPQSSDGREVRAKKVAAFDNLSALLASGQEFSKEDLFKMLETAK